MSRITTSFFAILTGLTFITLVGFDATSSMKCHWYIYRPYCSLMTPHELAEIEMNDTFKFNDQCFPGLGSRNLKFNQITTTIYNRQGEIQFESQDTSENWICEGVDCYITPGAYYYMINLVTDNDTQLLQGVIRLVDDH